MLLELRDLSRNFHIHREGFTLFSGVNLTIYGGESIALSGPSGSGKSTLLNIVAGLLPPSSGQVFFKGRPMPWWRDGLRSRNRNRHIGMIYQTFRLLPDESVWWNVTMPLRVSGRMNRNARDYTLSLLEETGIAHHRYSPARILSGGQQQRAAIVRALVMKPSLLLADEPSANLDPVTTDEIFALLNRQVAEGMAMLIVTHKDSMRQRAHRRYHLEKTMLVERI